MCIAWCRRYPWAPKEQWHRHADDACPLCNTPRFFKHAGAKGKQVMRPQKRFWFFGFGHALQSLFADPEFVRLRGTGRDEVDNGFRGSPEFQRLLAVLGAAFLTSPNTSTYEIGLDCGSMFTFRGHSTGIMGLRHAVLCILVIHVLPPHLAA